VGKYRLKTEAEIKQAHQAQFLPDAVPVSSMKDGFAYELRPVIEVVNNASTAKKVG